MKDEAVDRALKRSKLRRTAPRLRVLGVLIEASDPLTALDILARMRVHTDSVTVYRTLNSLIKRNIVHRVRGEDRIWRYAMGNTRESHAPQHPHFVCDGCGRVQCLKEIVLPRDLTKLLNVGRHHLVEFAEVILHGTCPKCVGIARSEH